MDALLLDTSAAGEDECDEGDPHQLHCEVKDIDVILPSPEDESDEDESVADVDDEQSGRSTSAHLVLLSSHRFRAYSLVAHGRALK